MPRRQRPSWLRHVFQNLFLIGLSLVFLLPDTFILLFSYVAKKTKHIAPLCRRHIAQNDPGVFPKTILVIGVCTPSGLALARTFFAAGHEVLGADYVVFGRYELSQHSAALKTYYPLFPPTTRQNYQRLIDQLIDIIDLHEVDLVVNCSCDVDPVVDAQIKNHIEQYTPCKILQAEINTLNLVLGHRFIEFSGQQGFPVPLVHWVTSEDQIMGILQQEGDTEFLLKPAHITNNPHGPVRRLSRDSITEAPEDMNDIIVSEQEPKLMQRVIEGDRYSTQALVIRGRVKLFVACPSSHHLMHYEALEIGSVLHRTMLKFVQDFAAEAGNTFSGFVSIDFVLVGEPGPNPDPSIIAPVRCEPRANNSLILFNGTPKLAEKYLSALTEQPTPGFAYPVKFPFRQIKYYWAGHDIVTYVFIDLVRMLRSKKSPKVYFQGLHTLAHRLMFEKDATFEIWDPLPWWYVYHIYWPIMFIGSLLGGWRWSSIDVRTGNVEKC